MTIFNLVIVLDESGSMASLEEVVESTLNNYIENFKKKNEETRLYEKILLSLYRFGTHDHITVSYNKIDIMEVPIKHGFNPQNSTPLYDGIGVALSDNKGIYHGICHIITDGEENGSRLFTHDQIYEMIKSMENYYDWTFQYTCIQKSFSTGIKLGIKPHNIYIFPSENSCDSDTYIRGYLDVINQQSMSSLEIGFANISLNQN